MRGNRARFPLIGALNGRYALVLLQVTNTAGFAPLLSFPGWDLLNVYSKPRLVAMVNKVAAEASPAALATLVREI